jgi:hypothetical protein
MDRIAAGTLGVCLIIAALIVALVPRPAPGPMPPPATAEVGRFQLVTAPGKAEPLLVFDTKTGRLWQRTRGPGMKFNEPWGEYTEAPWVSKDAKAP